MAPFVPFGPYLAQFCSVELCVAQYGWNIPFFAIYLWPFVHKDAQRAQLKILQSYILSKGSIFYNCFQRMFVLIPD